MSTATVEIGSLLIRDPRLREGRPCLARTQVTVHTIAALFMSGASPDEILIDFPQLDVPRIYAALTYYLANQAEVKADLERDRIWGAAMAAEFPDGWTTEDRSPRRQQDATNHIHFLTEPVTHAPR